MYFGWNEELALAPLCSRENCSPYNHILAINLIFVLTFTRTKCAYRLPGRA